VQAEHREANEDRGLRQRQDIGEDVQASTVCYRRVRVDDFDFELPDAAIAERPAEPRDASRLLCYDRATGAVAHRTFRNLGDSLRRNDVLVLNDTRVLPWRLVGKRASGGKVEALVVEKQGAACAGYLKPARKVRRDEAILMEGGALTLVPGSQREEGLHEFTLHAPAGQDLDAVLARVGRAPLPPYIARNGEEDVAADRARYQTVFAAHDGAIAAPTAGLHFTAELLDKLASQGIARVAVTLHVGLGTFAPVRAGEVEQHVMHQERYVLPASTADAIAQARGRGGRVVAVGTTAARTLEACADGSGGVRAGAGTTDLFLYPGKPLRVVDALITNFHLPRSTLLMLVAAMVGRERILALYREAIARGYRFYSFGDAMLIT
jgi:S-adenosylmethionine:tRNA ribosyltransferase-isomerase